MLIYIANMINMKNKSQNFVKSVSIVMIISLIGKILGLIKQVVIASFFGTSENTDLFFVSYSFVYGIAIALFSALSIVLLPMYSRERNIGVKEANLLFSKTLLLFVPISFIIMIIIQFFSPMFSNILIPGYSLSLKKTLSKFICYLSPVIIIYCVTSIFNTISDYNKNFLPGKILTPLFNFFVIIATVFLANYYGIKAIIFSVLISYSLYIIISFIYVKKYTKFYIINPFNDRTFLRNFLQLFPLLLGNAIMEINTIVDRAVASNLGIGIISTVTYAASINEIITTMIISNFSSIFYTYFTGLVIKDQKNQSKKYIINIIKGLFLFLVPVTIIICFNSQNIVDILYNHGNFNNNDVINTSLVIIGYSLGFIPTMISNILIKVHYAYGDTKRPMFNGIITVSINILLSIIISKTYGIIGISLSTSIATTVSALLCYISVKKYIKFHLSKENFITFIKIITIIILTILNCILFKKLIYINNNFFYLIILSLETILFYIFLLKIFKLQNLKTFIKNFNPKSK